MRKILQITPHLGGGLGRVLINWIRHDNNIGNNIHTLACLEKTLNATEDFSDLKKINFYDGLYLQEEKLRKLILESDIVIINWYNHPLIFKLLTQFKFPPSRLINYNHVSSLNPPYNMSEKLIKFFDETVFTTKASYEAEEIINLPENLKERLTTIESAFGSEKYIDYTDFLKKEYETFNVGYFGTASYAKLNSNFVEMCAAVKIPDVKFIVCSGDDQSHIIKDAEKFNAIDSFSFEGRVDYVEPYLKQFHVFGYPLQPKHLGSAEQVFGEAWMFGAVPVVLNNTAERYIVQNKITGIIANSINEYSEGIEYLYKNPDKRKEMAIKGRAFAEERYSINRKISLWEEVFEKVSQTPKTERRWLDNNFDITGAEVFIESIGDYGEIFKEYINRSNSNQNTNDLAYEIQKLFNNNIQWHSNNKGGVKQYLKYFPNDKYLLEWEALLI